MRIVVILLSMMLLTACPKQGPFYANCDAARSAGVTPLHRDDPGYRHELDQDDDGVACV